MYIAEYPMFAPPYNKVGDVAWENSSLANRRGFLEAVSNANALNLILTPLARMTAKKALSIAWRRLRQVTPMQ